MKGKPGRPFGTTHLVDGLPDREIVTPQELSNLLKVAESGSGYSDKRDDHFYERRDMALIAILALFGKRAGEVCRVRREHVYFESDRILIKFRILKRGKGKIRKAKKPIVYGGNKPRPLDNPLTKLILEYMKVRDVMYPNSPWLFPSTKDVGKSISSHRVWMIIRKLKPKDKIWPHWFRHSLAVRMVRHGEADIFDLMEWFDWKKPDVAVDYVRAEGKGRIEMLGKKDNWSH